jgi:hypothetical protein
VGLVLEVAALSSLVVLVVEVDVTVVVVLASPELLVLCETEVTPGPVERPGALLSPQARTRTEPVKATARAELCTMRNLARGPTAVTLEPGPFAPARSLNPAAYGFTEVCCSYKQIEYP